RPQDVRGVAYPSPPRLKTWVEIRVVLTSRLPMLSEWRGYGTPLPPLCERCARQGPANDWRWTSEFPRKLEDSLQRLAGCCLRLGAKGERRLSTQSVAKT